MSQVTVSQAAFLTGKSRQTINKFSKNGTLSFSLNAEQVKVIEIAELQRVFPLIRKIEELEQMELADEEEGGASADRQPGLAEQVAVLRERLENTARENALLKGERERERRQLEEQIEMLRESLQKAQDQGGKAMLMLTDQSSSERQKGLEQEKKVQELSETVLKLQQQNKRIYRALKESEGRGFWKNLFGREQGPKKASTAGSQG